MSIPQTLLKDSAWGYFNTPAMVDQDQKTFYTTLNVSNVVGMLPGIGPIMGIARIIFASASWLNHTNPTSEQRYFYGSQIIRGLNEVQSFRSIIAIIDIAQTILRHEKLIVECTKLIAQTVVEMRLLAKTAYDKVQERLNNFS